MFFRQIFFFRVNIALISVLLKDKLRPILIRSGGRGAAAEKGTTFISSNLIKVNIKKENTALHTMQERVLRFCKVSSSQIPLAVNKHNHEGGERIFEH